VFSAELEQPPSALVTASVDIASTHARVLSLRDRPIALAPKSFDLLLLLVDP
jgi:hypothetical protein